MALETVALQTASGATAYIAGDLIGTTFIPISKIDLGADGVSAPASGSLPVSLASQIPTGTNAIGKLAANSGVDIGDVDITNIVPGTGTANLGKAGGDAATLTDVGPASFFVRDDVLAPLGSPVVDGDYTQGRVDANGALWIQVAGAFSNTIDSIHATPIPGVPYVIHKNKRYSATATGDAFWTPASGKAIVLTYLRIATGGASAGIVTVWFGASGDVTFSTGTDKAAFDGEFAPSATSRPGDIQPNMFLPGTTDYVLRVTTTNNITVYIQAEGYEV